MQLTEEPPLPKGYPRTSITKAQRQALLEELRRRYRERKAERDAQEPDEEKKNTRQRLGEQVLWLKSQSKA